MTIVIDASGIHVPGSSAADRRALAMVPAGALARNALVVRAEVRHDVFPEVDLNFMDLLVLRRGQVRGFVDSGQVSNSAGHVYDVGSYAVGVGVGLAAVYDFMGFFPSMAYLEIATRVDEVGQIGDVQVLFGSRQAF